MSGFPDYSWLTQTTPKPVKAKVHLKPGPSYDVLSHKYVISDGFACNAVQYESAIYVIISTGASERHFSIPMDQVALVEWFEEEK